MAMSNAVFIADEGVGGTSFAVSVFHEVSVAPRSSRLERKTTDKEKRRERREEKEEKRGEKKRGRERDEIYVPDTFFHATTLTAYKVFAKRVWVLRTRRPRRFHDE